MVILPSIYLPIQVEKPSQFLIWILMLVVYIPSQIIPTYSLGFREEYATFQVVLFGCLSTICGLGLLPTLKIPEMKWSLRIYVVGLLAYSVVIMGWIVSQVGFPTSIPSFAAVYEQRAAYNEAMSAPGPIAYLIAWQTSVINPLLLLIGLHRRKWVIVATGISLNVLMYAIAGHKSDLLSSVLVIAVFIMYSFASYWRGVLLAMGATAILLISSVLWWVGDFIYPISIFVRRMIAVPGLLSGYYFEYFSEFGFTRQFGPLSILLKPVEMPLSTPRTIGLLYFGDSSTAANANLWADAYSALGYSGMVLTTLLLCLILWGMDSLMVSRPARVATPLFVIAMYSLTNSALPTSLLTHGILFTVLMIIFYPSTKYSIDTNSSKVSDTSVHRSVS